MPHRGAKVVYKIERMTMQGMCQRDPLPRRACESEKERRALFWRYGRKAALGLEVTAGGAHGDIARRLTR